MITIQQKLFRLLKIFSPAMQDQKLASPVIAYLQGEEQAAAAVLRLSHQVQAGSVFQADKGHFYSLPSFFPFVLPLPTSQLSIIRSGYLVPGPISFHHVVHADDRDADYDVGGVE